MTSIKRAALIAVACYGIAFLFGDAGIGRLFRGFGGLAMVFLVILLLQAGWQKLKGKPLPSV